MRLTIGARLVGGFLIVAALTGCIGVIAVRRFADITSSYDRAVQQYADRVIVGLELQVAVLDQVRSQKNYLLRGDAAYLEEIGQARQRVNAARADLSSHALDATQRDHLTRIGKQIDDLDAAFRESIKRRQAADTETADQLVRGRAARIVSDLDEFVSLAQADARKERAVAAKEAARTRRLTLALVAALGVVAVGLGVALSLSVTNPLKRLQSQINEMAAGGTTPSEPAATGRDEVAQIAKAFHEMVRRAALLREMENRSKRLAALSTRVARAQEEERERIARELHDVLGQALTAIKLDVSAARRSLPEDDEDTPDYLDKARRLTEESLDELRRIVFDLRPPALDHLGLVAALESYCRAFEQRSGIKVRVSANGLRSRLPFDVETALYRICQEALTNVSKHAEATKCTLRLDHARDAIRLTVQDDGRGFDAATLAQPNGGTVRGIGILSMERRAEDLGGDFRIESNPGEGTAILVAVPLSSKG